MKKELLFAFAAFFFMSLSAITGVYAGEQDQKTVTLSKDKVDVTGDQKADTVYLKGIYYEEGASFLKEISLKVKASDGKTYKAELEGGYEPQIQFEDLNHDSINDMYISIPTGGSGGLSNFYLFTLKEFKLIDLSVPDPLVINSQFENGYKATISIQDTKQSYTFDLRDRGEEYERLGLYVNGKLSEPTELMVNPYSTLKIIPIEGKKGLMGVQRISGAYNADTIAFAESFWLYEDGKWVLKDTKVMNMNSRKR
ncbi:MULTISPECIES: hypothetical protein [unclassified Cytobacillus]|uniref:hypothetical protein n=1 Tax=unclassified Cytobacillus TaxID=2675268 RepID=UPI0020412486|nr:hypothetical protein [Cytobacillus sp. AMY 15.2]MCM3091722.1 hypothetical protein [Cytobacillus sp. AMY 15.2]